MQQAVAELNQDVQQSWLRLHAGDLQRLQPDRSTKTPHHEETDAQGAQGYMQPALR